MAITLSLFAQQGNTECSCCTEHHQQFDFWIGDWNVIDSSGTVMGNNSVERMQDGCVLRENWRGTKGSTGTSYNYFNRTDSTWNQTWIDNSGGSLVLKGNPQKGAMVLKSEILQGAKGKEYFHEITWTPQQDGSVTQIWLLKSADGIPLRTAFYGTYQKKR